MIRTSTSATTSGRAALPSPGGDAELSEWAADFFSHRLDRTRPLWEMVLVDGLDEGRWALATKTHHCLVDGVGSVNVTDLLLDAEPKPKRRGGSGAPPIESQVGGGLASHMPDAIAELARTGARAASGGAHMALHPRETLERSRAMAELIVRDELISAPHTSLNEPIGSTRRFEIVRASLPELKAIGHALGGTFNDVVLAACTTGLRNLLLSRGEEPPAAGLRAMVPMNIREASEQLALGNRVSSLFVELPVAEPGPRERLDTIVERMRKLKSGRAALGADTLLDLTSLAPPVLHAALASSMYATRLFNVTITNVPGSRTPLYAYGSQLREVHPLVPLAASHAVGIAIVTYNEGSCSASTRTATRPRTSTCSRRGSSTASPSCEGSAGRTRRRAPTPYRRLDPTLTATARRSSRTFRRAAAGAPLRHSRAARLSGAGPRRRRPCPWSRRSSRSPS